MDETSLSSIRIPDATPETPEEEKSLALVVTFVMAPMQLAEPTTIKLRAIIDGEELKGNALKVRLPTQEELQNNLGIV